jgi:dihydrodipicolinate synthase/N-acetylneuraminate lyase
MSGVYVTTVTPFRENLELDEEGVATLVSFLVDQGVTYIVPLGTSGEFSSLTLAEKKRVIKITLDHAGKAEVIPGVSSTSYKEVIELASYSGNLGVSSVLLVPPYYLRSRIEGFKRLISEVISKCKVGVWVYNNPQQVGYELTVRDMSELASIDGVVGFKDATHNLLAHKALIEAVGKTKKVLGGLEEYGYFSMLMGSHGFTSSMANFLPALPLRIYTSLVNHDFAEANRLANLMLLYRLPMLRGSQPLMMHFAKIGLKKMGIIQSASVRPPLINLTEDERSEIDRTIEGILHQLEKPVTTS